MVTRTIATTRATAAYCHGVHVKLQIDCVSLCHGGKGNNKLCKMMDDFDDPSSSEEDSGNEDHANSV